METMPKATARHRARNVMALTSKAGPALPVIPVTVQYGLVIEHLRIGRYKGAAGLLLFLFQGRSLVAIDG